MARRREVVREEPVVYEEKRPPRHGIVRRIIGAFASLAGWLIGLTLLAVLVVVVIIVLV